MIILGVETSCDDTGIGIYDSTRRKLLSNVTHDQIKIHNKYGGVIPELAARNHAVNIKYVLEKAMQKANIVYKDIDAIAYTAMPGLISSLMVGAAFSKALGYVLDIESIPINHLEGHIMSPFLDENSIIKYPFMALLVSGGHSQLVKVKRFGNYSTIGESLDDAAGEAFDKVGKILGLPYPGGPYLEKLAQLGCKKRFHFPRAMCNRPGLDFSFSGLKTSVFRAWEECKNKNDIKEKADIARGFEEAITDIISIKCKRALKENPEIKNLVVVGGVSANKNLREKINRLLKNRININYPSLKFCTDNGAMIALAGAHRIAYNNKNGKKIEKFKIVVEARSQIL